MEYYKIMSDNVVIFLFGTLLTVIGFLIAMYLRQLAQRLDKIDEYIERHDEVMLGLREKYHEIINEHIAPLNQKVLLLQERLKNEKRLD